MSVYRLIYISSATTGMSPPELLKLLAIARERNARADVTGMLLYRDQSFMQVLEGAEAAVRSLFARIERDPRHENVALISRGPVMSRDFADWSMAFRDLSRSTESPVPGYSDFLNIPFHQISFWRQPSHCQELLLSFRASLA